MINIPNLRVFEICYISPTNTKGARIRIKDLRHNKTVIIPFEYADSNIKDTARTFLKSKGITCVSQGEGKKSYLLLSRDFGRQIR